MNNHERFLSVIMTWPALSDICEALGGWANDAWHTLLSGCGDITMTPDGKGWWRDGQDGIDCDTAVSIVRLVHFDCDYENFLLAQVWDRRDPVDARHWKYVLFFNTGRNEWVPDIIAAWDDHPKLAVVGGVVDDWPVS
jgi:hypothetical protein